MRFSICIPSLNEEKYIDKLLTCLTRQTFKDFEVIVSDGKSEDKTKDIVLSFKDKLDIKFIESPERGVSFQRNYAAKNSEGEYIIFFDADVQISDIFLEKIDEFLEEKNVDVLTSWNKPLSNRADDKFLFFLTNVLCLELIKRTAPGAVGVFICVRRSSFEKVGGFKENISFAEDYELVRRLHRNSFKYALLKKPPIEVSVRRLEKEGRLHMVGKTLKAGVYYLLCGEGFAEKLKGKIVHESGKF
ncbi:MAG: glycosyltransferase [Patescibacteria group bacterium]